MKFIIKKGEIEMGKYKYQIILSFNKEKGISDIKSILFDKRPTEEEAEQGKELYGADSYRIVEVENITLK